MRCRCRSAAEIPLPSRRPRCLPRKAAPGRSSQAVGTAFAIATPRELRPRVPSAPQQVQERGGSSPEWRRPRPKLHFGPARKAAGNPTATPEGRAQSCPENGASPSAGNRRKGRTGTSVSLVREANCLRTVTAYGPRAPAMPEMNEVGAHSYGPGCSQSGTVPLRGPEGHRS